MFKVKEARATVARAAVVEQQLLLRVSSHVEKRRQRTRPPVCERPRTSVERSGNKACAQTVTARSNVAHISQDTYWATRILDNSTTAQFEALKMWINSYGGYVHPSLALSDKTATGCRGLVAASDIPLDEVVDRPLVAVPGGLCMTAETASQKLDPLLARAGLPPSSSAFEEGMQLALLLAHEMRQGQASFWHPYIDLLPRDMPANPWLLEHADLQPCLQQLGPMADGWDRAVQDAAQYAHSQAATAVQRCGAALGGLTEEDLLWGMSMVSSRCFGTLPSMAPLVDLCNHSCAALHPAWMPVGEEMMMQCVVSRLNGEPQALRAGDELFISYLLDDVSPLDAFLTFGFVPEEMLRPCTAAESRTISFAQR